MSLFEDVDLGFKGGDFLLGEGKLLFDFFGVDFLLVNILKSEEVLCLLLGELIVFLLNYERVLIELDSKKFKLLLEDIVLECRIMTRTVTIVMIVIDMIIVSVVMVYVCR